MAIYLTGAPASALLSFILGGWLNEMYGWRATFFLLGVPGLLLAALVKLTIVEPRAWVREAPRPAPSMRTVFLTLWRQRSCRHLGFALILLYTMSMGMAPWYAAFMIRSHGMGTTELGVWLGLIISLGGIVGILVGGYAASLWGENNEPRQMRMSAVTVAALVPFFIAFLTVPEKYQALMALVPLVVVFNVFLGPTYALLQRLVPDDMRATMMAVVMMLANLIGMGLGPQIVGILSDLLQPALQTDSLRYAMLIMSFVALWSAYHFWHVGHTVVEDLRQVARHGERVEEAGAYVRMVPKHAAAD
jgi:MFS family permease